MRDVAIVSFAQAPSVRRERRRNEVEILMPVVREAVEQRKHLKDHYAHMVVHGMLHLYGHDHVERQQADVMEGIEREILAQVGVGDPYGGQPGSG